MKSFWKILAVLGIILALAAIVYGSLLPLMKARKYISASRSIGSMKNLAEFEATFDYLFDFSSPVGEEEVAKFSGDQIAKLIANPNQGEEAARELARFIEPRLDQENVRHLILLGRIHATLWRKYAVDEDFAKAESFFLKAREIGPRLPQVLYGLVELYALRGDQDRVNEIGKIILEYWPSDPRFQVVGPGA